MIGQDHRCVIQVNDGVGWIFWRRHQALAAAIAAAAGIASAHDVVRVLRRNEIMAMWEYGFRLSTFAIETRRVQQQQAKVTRKPDYVPPERPPVVLRDPVTGKAVELEVVFDGR